MNTTELADELSNYLRWTVVDTQTTDMLQRTTGILLVGLMMSIGIMERARDSRARFAR